MEAAASRPAARRRAEATRQAAPTSSRAVDVPFDEIHEQHDRVLLFQLEREESARSLICA